MKIHEEIPQRIDPRLQRLDTLRTVLDIARFSLVPLHSNPPNHRGRVENPAVSFMWREWL